MSEDNDDDDTFDDIEDDDIFDDIEETETSKYSSRNHLDARRRLEQLKEDKELERLTKGQLGDWYDDLYDDLYDDPY